MLRNMSEEKMYTSVRMVFLSNLLESKGILDLLDALSLLRQRGCLFTCDIVGAETSEINRERLLKEIAQRELDGVAIYKGSMFGDEKTQVLKDADLFIHPTHDDCFPLVLLEAMAHGLPCISTNEGAIADIIDNGKTGLIFEKNNPQDLADTIEALLNNETLRNRMGVEGRKKYEQEYTLEHFEQRFVQCMNSILTDI